MLLAPVLLAAAVLIAYSNTPGNAFALDDWHTIEQNPWIRGLNWPHIHRFFTDASAFSVLRTNLDYRPVLLVTYAANYAISGYETWSWHWVNLALHWIVVVHLFLLGRILIGSGGLAAANGLSRRDGDLISLGSALVFAVHPITTGCANYISARSSLLVAALALPALVMYLAAMAGRGRTLWLAPALLLFVLAMFTKVEAVALIGVLVLAEALLNPRARELPIWKRPLRLMPWLRLAIFVAAAIGYIVVWRVVSPLKDNDQRAAGGMTAGVYLLTEVRAWWYYIGQVLAPVRLVADESAYPVSGGIATTAQIAAGEPLYSLARALRDPRVLLAIAAWAGAGLLCLRWLRTAPVVAFLVGSYLILLSPHSSVVPLFELVNEHRPYLPVAGLFLILGLGLWLALRALSARPRFTFALCVIFLCIPLVALTRERNTVWKDDLSLWADTAAKTPESARAQLNYGLALYKRGKDRYAEAESRYRRSLALAPNYHYAHTNLAILLEAKGDLAAAAAEHDAAVRSSPTQSGPYAWRARFRAKRGDLAGATADFEASVKNNPSPYVELAGLVECLERSGRGDEARKWLERFPPPDPAGFKRDREVVAALLGVPTSMGQMSTGLVLMRQAKYPEAEELFRQAISLDPSNQYAHINMGVLCAARGDPAGARTWFDDAIKMAPTDAAPLYWRGRFHAAQGDLPAAITDLRAAAALAPASVLERAALIECLIRAGRGEDARGLIDAAPAGGAAALEEARAVFRAEVPAMK